MRRAAFWCVVGVALLGCDSAGTGVPFGGGDVVGGADGMTVEDTGGGSSTLLDVGGTPGDTGAAVDSGGITDVTTAKDTGSAPDVGLPDISSPADTATPKDTAAPKDTGKPDTAAPVDTAPQDTGPPPGDPMALVITELLYDAAAVDDSAGEWVEILNTGADAVNLVGLSLGDSAGTHTISSASPLWVPAGGYAVLAKSADPAKNGGFTPLYAYSGVDLNNGGDSVVLLAGTVEIDRVDYATSKGWPDAKGKSLQLDGALDPTGDHNVPADWCLGTTPYGLGDLGSPGAKNPDCPKAPDTGDPSALVITEIMYDPTAIGDSSGEYVELFNTGAKDVDLRGLSFGDSSAATEIDDASPLLVPAGGRALVGKSKDSAKNGGLTVLWTFGFGLNNDKDSVILSKGGVEIDRVDYDESKGWPVAAGVSIQVDGSKAPGTIDNALPASWCLSTAKASSGDLGTPGTENTSCGGPVGGCAGNCSGQDPDGCWCDAECVANGDCCVDACDACGHCASSCVGYCDGESPDGCYCDTDCLGFGDCCADICSACGYCQ